MEKPNGCVMVMCVQAFLEDYAFDLVYFEPPGRRQVVFQEYPEQHQAAMATDSVPFHVTCKAKPEDVKSRM